jgi:hypothetical protein
MGTIVVVLLLALALAAVIMFYVAFPYRGEETPLTPRLGEMLRRGVESMPTLDTQRQQERRAEGGRPIDAGVDTHR